MKSLSLINDLRQGGTVLCLGAHSDDIEIGCGGTLLNLLEDSSDVTVNWVVLSASGARKHEAQASANLFLKHAATRNIIIKDFRNGFFPYVATEIKEFVETLKDLPAPDLILTHYDKDMHQDHRIVSELTRNTFRNHLILEYEIPKYDGDTGSPNMFVPLEATHLRSKVSALETYFGSQHDKQWFSSDTFEGLARLRGIQCNSRTGHAEAFYCRKSVL